MPVRSQPVIGRIVARWREAGDATCMTLMGLDGFKTYSGNQLCELAGRYAASFVAQGVKPGDRIALVLPTGEPFIGAFFGAWWAGAVAMPMAPPMQRQDLAHERARLMHTLKVAKPRLLVTEAAWLDAFDDAPVTVVLPEALNQGEPIAMPSNEGDLAIIQFSSGSTGHPKGIMLRDEQIHANMAAISAAIQEGPDDRIVSWAPFHHDMGLIGVLIWSQYAGVRVAIMPPEAFIFDPSLWLKAIDQQRATLSVAPNFAYQICARLSPQRLEGLDLSCWRVSIIGAEPIRPSSMRAFLDKMAPYGVRPEILMPTLGIAEATLCVSTMPVGEGLRLDRIDRQAYYADRVAKPAEAEETEYLEIPSVGVPMLETIVEIRGESGQTLPERQVGEICVKSGSVMVGYFEAPEATAEALTDDGFLRTGDLGYMADGYVYISGRIKDMIIRGGSNYYPQDLEAVCEAHEAVRMGGCAAFVVESGQERTERVVVLAEVRKGMAPPPDLARELRSRIHEATGLRVDDVILLKPYQVPKTTSGKIRRAEARQRYLAGTIERFDG